MSSSAQESLQTIDQFLDQVGGQPEKQAAEAHTEAGSQGGETSHPVKDVDDRTETAEEGARSAENTADVKDPDIGPGAPSVDATAEATAKVGSEGTAADDQMQIGTNVQATGDDPSNETDGTKPGKEDGGFEGASSHPARTDNDALDGHKYSADLSEMPLEKLAAEMSDLGNQICADLANEATDATKQAASTCRGCGKGQSDCSCGMYGSDNGSKEASAEGEGSEKQAAIDPKLAQQLGWEMAGLVTGNFDKKAADALVQNTLKDVIKTASDDADNTAEYLTNYFQAQKQAMGEDPMGGAPGGELPPEALAAMAGGEGGGPEGPPPGPPMGGPEEPAMGGDPAAALGAEGGEMGGGGDEAMQLAQILDSLGVSPEELQAAMAAEGGGMGGPPPEGLGGEAPEGAGAPGELGGLGEAPAGPGEEEVGAMEAQAGDKQASEPMTKEKQAEVTNYIKEVVGRSRQKKAAEAAKVS